MSRTITDASLVVATALPAAAASVTSSSIDLGGAGIASLEAIELKVDLPILPALVDTKTVTITVLDSADNSSFTAIAGLGTLVATGTETPGTAAALSRSYKLPSTTRRYVAVSAAVLAAGGDNTAVSYTWQILT
jgi:hypothetical protein